MFVYSFCFTLEDTPEVLGPVRFSLFDILDGQLKIDWPIGVFFNTPVYAICSFV